MTLALCLFCGERKVGAISPCRGCGHESTGDFDLDVTFTDRRMSHSNIADLGTVIKVIRARAVTDDLTFWAFISHISREHPELLKAEPPAELEQEVNSVLGDVDLPTVHLELHELTGGGAGSQGSIGCIAALLILDVAVFGAAYLVSDRLQHWNEVGPLLLAAVGLVIFIALVAVVEEYVRDLIRARGDRE